MIHLYIVIVCSCLQWFGVSEMRDGLELLLAICSLWQLYKLSQETKRDQQ